MRRLVSRVMKIIGDIHAMSRCMISNPRLMESIRKCGYEKNFYEMREYQKEAKKEKYFVSGMYGTSPFRHLRKLL